CNRNTRFAYYKDLRQFFVHIAADASLRRIAQGGAANAVLNREVLRLQFASKLPQRAIAKSLGLSQGAVSGYLSRTLAAFSRKPLILVGCAVLVCLRGEGD